MKHYENPDYRRPGALNNLNSRISNRMFHAYVDSDNERTPVANHRISEDEAIALAAGAHPIDEFADQWPFEYPDGSPIRVNRRSHIPLRQHKTYFTPCVYCGSSTTRENRYRYCDSCLKPQPDKSDEPPAPIDPIPPA